MDMQTLLENCERQEELYQFGRFTRTDALNLGLKIHENAQQYPDPVAIEITVNGLVVFRYFPDGTIPDSELWLARKRRTVDLMQMSSLHFMAWLETTQQTLASRGLDSTQYAAGGGGFPIAIHGVGVVGSICVSGMPDHMDDHQLVVDSIADFLSKK